MVATSSITVKRSVSTIIEMEKKTTAAGAKHDRDIRLTSRRKPRNGRIVLQSRDVLHETRGHLDEDKIGILMVNDGFRLESVVERDEDDFYKDYYLDDDDTGPPNDSKNNETLAHPRPDENASEIVENGILEKSKVDDGEKPATDVAQAKTPTSNISSATKEERSNKNRRLTRRMARDIDEERAHIGLSTLVDAMFELEQDMGAMLPPKKRHKLQASPAETRENTLPRSGIDTPNCDGPKNEENTKRPSKGNSKRQGASGTKKKAGKSGKKHRVVVTSAASAASDCPGQYLLAAVFKGTSSSTNQSFRQDSGDGNSIKRLIKVTRIIVNGDALEIPIYKEKPSFEECSAATNVLDTNAQIEIIQEDTKVSPKPVAILEQPVVSTQQEIIPAQPGNVDQTDAVEPPTVPPKEYRTLDFLDLRCRHLPAEEGGLKIGVLTWEAINPYLNSNFPSEASSQVPAISRHDESVYAGWCSTLLNALAGSARCFACHEFFYSDIDRGWYNFSDYTWNLAKVGVQPSTKLSRLEWSFIRRNVRRPRRFSQSFIASELANLESHRALVREVQRGKCKRPLGIVYEIPALIGVGSTVTAYHKKTRMIQRGVILSQDRIKPGYVVMFDRKELGCEFCPDTDVASHGPPNVYAPRIDSAVDGSAIRGLNDPHLVPGSLPYGTMHNMDVFVKSRIEKSYPHLVSTSGQNTAAEFEMMIDAAAEREALMKLMSLLDALTERKSFLLDALDKMHSSVPHSRTNRPSPEVERIDFSGEFQEHYAWLCANLDETNERIDAALVHLQFAYGNVYSSSGIGRIRRSDSVAAQTNEYSEKWATNVAETASALSSDLVRSVKQDRVVEREGSWDLGHSNSARDCFVGKDCESLLDNRLTSAAKLLLSAGICIDEIRGSGTAYKVWSDVIEEVDSKPQASEERLRNPSNIESNAIKRALNDVLLSLRPDMRVNTYSIDVTRAAAFRELQEAMELLQSELGEPSP